MWVDVCALPDHLLGCLSLMAIMDFYSYSATHDLTEELSSEESSKVSLFESEDRW